MPGIPTAFSDRVFARKNFSSAPETGKSIQSPVGIRKLYVHETGKGRIPPQPKLLEPRAVALNKRRDEIQDALGVEPDQLIRHLKIPTHVHVHGRHTYPVLDLHAANSNRLE